MSNNGEKERFFLEKYEYVFDAEKQIVIDELMDGVIKADFSGYVELFEKDAIYGNISKNKVCLYHGTPFRNSFRPVFVAKIVEGVQTTIIGKWRLPGRLNVFIVMWYLFLIWMSIVPLVIDGQGNLPLLYATVIVFALSLAVFVAVSCLIERKRIKKVIEHIENVQKRLIKNV